MIDLNPDWALPTRNVSGKELNALGYYPTPTEADSVVVQGDLAKAVGVGETVRLRVIETYTDPKGYRMEGGELVWDRTLGRPYNEITLPTGWKLTGMSAPAIVSTDGEGRVVCRVTNPRNDEARVVVRGRKK